MRRKEFTRLSCMRCSRSEDFDGGLEHFKLPSHWHYVGMTEFDGKGTEVGGVTFDLCDVCFYNFMDFVQGPDGPHRNQAGAVAI